MTSLLERLGRWNLKRLTAESRSVVVGGTRMHYYDVPGPAETGTLVLLHGIGSSASTFAPLLKRVRPAFSRIILPEIPGHGFSEAPASAMTPDNMFELVAGLLDSLGDAPFTLYGNSLGGGAAIRYAIERSERVERLVLLSPAGAPAEDELGFSGLLERFDLRTLRDARTFMKGLFHRPRWYYRFAARDLMRRLAHPSVRQFLDTITVDDQLRADAVHQLGMPILFMWGGAERVLPAAHLEWFRAHLPGTATILTPEHFGHSAQVEFPDEVAAHLLAFREG